LGAFLIGVLALRLLGAYSSASRPPVLAVLPAFALVDQTGAPFRSEQLVGRVWIASFIYTTCPGPCPRVVERMADVQRRLEGEPDLRIVSFSVDPEADTPEVLAAYGQSRAIDPQRWKLLTGNADDVLKLVRGGFMLALARAEEAEGVDLTSSGPVVHSVHLVLVDRSLQVRGYYESTDPEAMTRLVADARLLLHHPNA
jgi:protein SCO1/2